MIRATGSNDTSCAGLDSSQSSSTGGGGEPLSSSTQPFPSGIPVSAPDGSQQTTPSGNHRKRVQIIIGVTVGVGVPLLLAAILIPLIRRRGRRMSGVRELSPGLLSSPVVEVDPHMLEASPKPFDLVHSRNPSYAESAPFLSASRDGSGAETTLQVPVSYSPYDALHPASGSQSAAIGSLPVAPPAATSLSASEKRKLHVVNDHLPAPSSAASLAQPSSAASGHLQPQQGAPGSAGDAEEEPNPQDVIVQHRDAGTAVVRELPLPYTDLTRTSSYTPQNQPAE